MKLIAHRGLLNGPNSHLENLPGQILLSLQAGYDCEIDVRFIDGKWMLGHDNPDFEVPFEFLEQSGLWLHAKNLEALHQLSKTNLVYFWHQNDDYVITSNSYIWAYPGKPLTSRSVMVLPEWADPTLKNIIDVNCFGICSDYPEKIKQILDQTLWPKQRTPSSYL
jgi:hypothetical protein